MNTKDTTDTKGKREDFFLWVRCVLVLFAAVLPSSAQRVERMTEARVRALAREAEAEGRDDRNAVVLALDRRVRERWGQFETFPVSIVRREDLTILLTMPYMGYRRLLAEYLRMREPLKTVPWVDAAVISVSPDRKYAPDIVEIVVERSGKRITPTKNHIKPMNFVNGLGETARLRAGEVHFPAAAFAPGATVTIAAVPESGDPFTLTLEDSQLQELK